MFDIIGHIFQHCCYALFDIIGHIPTTTVAATTTTPVTCLAGYELFAAVGNGWCVKFEISLSLNHTEAVTQCQADGIGEGLATQLAVINTLEKYNVIVNKIAADYSGKSSFIISFDVLV